jgi:DNA repair exonuclease SbcCD nuclease subunit
MQIISTETEVAIIETFSECFDKYPNINFISISGNHDYATKNLIGSPAISAQETLAVVFHERFKLIDYERFKLGQAESGQDIYLYGIPYFEYPEHFKTSLEFVNDKLCTSENDLNILLMHQTVSMTNGVVEDDIAPEHPLFDKYDYIFNGHVHQTKKITDKFFNIGSPKHRDAGDVDKDRGFYIFFFDEQGGHEFISTNGKFPQYRYKTIGDKIPEDQVNDYIIYQQPVEEVSKEDSYLMESFSEAGSPSKVIEVYGKESKLDKQTIAYGIKLLA